MSGLSVHELAAEVAAIVASLLQPPCHVTASDCPSAAWSRILAILPMIMRLDATCVSPCCVPNCGVVPCPEFVWSPENQEDHADNIKQVLGYLAQYLLPDGVVALPVQSLSWLQGCFRFQEAGSLVIDQSKTDYGGWSAAVNKTPGFS